MKILVAYFSTTGNTEKVAEAIREGINGHEVDLFDIKNGNPESLDTYDLAFLGSGIFAFNASRKLTSFVKKIPSVPPKLAYFYTHGNPEQAPYPYSFDSINKITEKNGCECMGIFDCCGENKAKNAKMQREALWSKLSQDDKKKAEDDFLNNVKGHPDIKDLENAKEFAALIINKLS